MVADDMDLETRMTLLVGATGVLGLMLGAFMWWTWQRGKRFNQALDQVARKLKLRVSINSYAAASWAEGTVDGHDVSLKRTSRSTSGVGTGKQRYFLEYRVRVPLSGDVRIVPAGTWLPAVVDHSGAGMRKTPIGEPDFDTAYDVWGAKKQAVKRLQVLEVRQGIVEFLTRGGMLENSELVFERVHVPTTAQGLFDDLQPMLDLAKLVRGNG